MFWRKKLTNDAVKTGVRQTDLISFASFMSPGIRTNCKKRDYIPQMGDVFLIGVWFNELRWEG